MPKGSKYSDSDHERVEELEKWKIQKEIDDGINEGISKWIRTVCVTSSSAIMGMLYWLGSIAYTKSAAISAAIKAFLLADRGGQ